MDKIKVGIVNVTGYAGIELARLLLKHPGVDLVSGTGRSAAGQRLADVFPHLTGVAELTVESELGNVDFAFVAMPHRESALEVMKLMERSIKVVDISADFRLSNPDDYNEWYGLPIRRLSFWIRRFTDCPSYTGRISYRLIWLPIRAVIPPAPFWRWLRLLKTASSEDIIIDSKSGVSGAEGRWRWAATTRKPTKIHRLMP